VQYIFSVYLIYNVYPVLAEQMTIKQDVLFSYLIPALLSLFAGVFAFNKDIKISNIFSKIDRKQAVDLGNLLIGVSLFFDVLPLPGIKSIVSFTYYLKYIGVMCFLFAPSGRNYSVIAIIYLLLVREALQGGIFIDFFMWSTYLFLIVSLRYEFSLRLRALFIVLAVPLLILIQSVKYEYRKATWSGKRETGVELITELAVEKEKQRDDPFNQSEGVVRTVGRLNQGWHLGMVLRWVPSHESFSNGEDFLGDVGAAILPRFFFPNKKMGGSQDKFYKYTGRKLTKTTSMTIGVLGDFYINFGREGSFLALFIFGAVVSRLVYFFIRKYVLPDPINVIWIPFLFSYLVRANNDFYFVFNNLSKGFLIFIAINYLRKQLWPNRPINYQRQ
jgi:hypothetical protein